MLRANWIIATGLLVLTASLTASAAEPGDWPMWRYDANRGASTPVALPTELHLQWDRQLPAPAPAWPPTQTKLQFDIAPQPVVLGQRIFVPSSSTDSLTAYDTRTGEEIWRFYANGPIRFSAAAAQGRIYFTSDDGCLYCVTAAEGELVWKFNGGPSQRAILGNGRLVSSWPARGGPVLHNGRIYFATSIWPFMGIFIHAVDAATGEVVWTNSGDGTNWTVHPHNAPSFGGVAPQGHLVVSGDNLIVPGGRSMPAVYDTATGKLRFFEFDKKYGGHAVSATSHTFSVAGKSYNLTDGKSIEASTPTVFDRQLQVHASGSTVRLSSGDLKIEEKEVVDRRGKKANVKQLVRTPLGQVQLSSSSEKIMLKAGRQLYTAGKGKIAAYQLPETINGKPAIKPHWSARIEGQVVEMVAADNRLFVVTAAGRMYCFGQQKITPRSHNLAKPISEPVEELYLKQARQILEAGKSGSAGIALVMGIGNGQLCRAIASLSDRQVIAIDADPQKVNTLRHSLQAVGAYGRQFSVIQADPAAFVFPEYMATLITSADPEFSSTARLAEILFKPLRPYGGLACIALSDRQHADFAQQVDAAGLVNAEVRREGSYTVLQRVGALKNSGEWTHQYGDASQTVVSKDKRVKAPVGVLWFGGPSHDGILPRHGHGPSPQVAGGRLVIEGPDMLRAVDVYTGRVLWETEMKGLGEYYNKTIHFAGAGEIGSNYVTLADSVYAVYGGEIRKLDATNGKLTRTFKLEDGANFGHISVQGDVLVTTAAPVAADAKKGLTLARYAPGSKRIVAFNRHSGKQLWSRTAEFNFRHNNIALASGRLFCIDSMTSARLQLMARRGMQPTGKPVLYALDLSTGDIIWSKSGNVSGTFLNYSAVHDTLLQAGSAYRDRAKDESGTGVVAYRGSDGKILWDQSKLKHGGPCLLWRDKIITNGGGGFALDIKTGQQTGWKYKRMYGCNTAIGSEHLLTFRSGAAGFYDLAGDSGTGNIGGFKSSCTANLIVADGVLNAPDYTRTCSCAYQNQTSLALIHMPDGEFWTFGGNGDGGRMGINLAAPGDRRSPAGTLWKSKHKARIEPAGAEEFRLHSSLVSGDAIRWVAGSGLKEVTRITATVTPAKSYRVRLYFLEPETISDGDRVFDVALQGKNVLTGFDVQKEAGAARRSIAREFNAGAKDGQIVVEFSPSTPRGAVLSGIEVIEQ